MGRTDKQRSTDRRPRSPLAEHAGGAPSRSRPSTRGTPSEAPLPALVAAALGPQGLGSREGVRRAFESGPGLVNALQRGAGNRATASFLGHLGAARAGTPAVRGVVQRGSPPSPPKPALTFFVKGTQITADEAGTTEIGVTDGTGKGWVAKEAKDGAALASAAALGTFAPVA